MSEEHSALRAAVDTEIKHVVRVSNAWLNSRVVGKFYEIVRHELATLLQDERRAAVEEDRKRVDVVQQDLPCIIAVAEKHGWNGVENSRVLSVWLDQTLSNKVWPIDSGPEPEASAVSPPVGDANRVAPDGGDNRGEDPGGEPEVETVAECYDNLTRLRSLCDRAVSARDELAFALDQLREAAMQVYTDWQRPEGYEPDSGDENETKDLMDHMLDCCGDSSKRIWWDRLKRERDDAIASATPGIEREAAVKAQTLICQQPEKDMAEIITSAYRPLAEAVQWAIDHWEDPNRKLTAYVGLVNTLRKVIGDA